MYTLRREKKKRHEIRAVQFAKDGKEFRWIIQKHEINAC